jgi:hypothetical protein
VCLYAFNLFVLITTMFMRGGDQVKPMILGPALAIRKFFVTFMVFSFSLFTRKNHKNIGY